MSFLTISEYAHKNAQESCHKRDSRLSVSSLVRRWQNRCGSSKLSASEFSMQEASPWTAALRMARSSTAVHRCQLVELSLVYQDPGVNLPPNPDSDRIWFGIGNC